MLSDEVDVINQAHGLLQARVNQDPGKHGRIDPFHPLYQLRSGISKAGQDLFQRPPIVVCFVGFTIAEVCSRKRSRTCQIILHARHPQGLQIKQMPGVFLR